MDGCVDNGTRFCNNTGSSGGSGRPGGSSGGGGYGGRPGSGGRPMGPCGYCTTSCVYSSIEICFIIGVVANALVIASVYRDRRLRESTFIGIACLAFADALFLLVNIADSIDKVNSTVSCEVPQLRGNRPFYIVLSVTWFAANGHVSLMAILRYLILVYPLRANMILNKKRVFLMSLGVWVVGGILIGTLTLLIVYGYILAGKSQEFVVILWGVVYLMPLVVTTILHLLKLFNVRKSTRETATEATRKSIQLMSMIVIIVILFAMILPLPRLVLKFINVTAGRDAYPSPEFKTHYEGIANLLYQINHFINPFMYAFLSPRFRASLKDMITCRKSTTDTSQDTMETPLSSRRHKMSLDVIDPKGSVESLGSLGNKV